MPGLTRFNLLPGLRHLGRKATGKTPVPVAQCSACEKQFRIQVDRRPLPDGGEQVTFSCPHCREEYTIAVVTKRGKMIQERITAIRKELIVLRGTGVEDEAIVDRQRLLLEFEGLRGELECEMKP